VGFNCAANGVLFRQSGAEELFVQPVSGDAGCAIGAALEAVRRKGRLPIPSERLRSTAFGPSFSDAQVAAALDRAKISYEHVGARITDVAARAIASGAIIGWFQGPCEGGPRALGNRSILADPRSVAQRDRVNGDVKRRETWRPLAPSIASHARDDFLVGSAPVDFMNVACAATPHAKATIPATVHVDGSVRPQLVTDAANPLFAELLRRFEHETGVPALLNTSFNQRDEPIVCAPIDAIRTFYSTPLDALAMGGFFVAK
jgi:carbamoyltransferase